MPTPEAVQIAEKAVEHVSSVGTAYVAILLTWIGTKVYSMDKKIDKHNGRINKVETRCAKTRGMLAVTLDLPMEDDEE